MAGSRLLAFFRRFKLRGVSTPFGGASFELRESDRKILRDLLIELEGRRVLKTDFADEDYEHVTLSVIEIRKELTTILQRLHDKSPATEPIRPTATGLRGVPDALPARRRLRL